MEESLKIMNIKKTRLIEIKTLYRPMQLVQLYLLFIIILYVLGPLEWRTQNSFLFYIFLFASQGLLLLGYTLQIKRLYVKETIEQTLENRQGLILSDEAVLKYLKKIIPINLLLTFMYLLRNTGVSGFSITQMISNLTRGFVDSGMQYSAKFTTEIAFGGNFLAPIITLMSPFTWIVIPLSLIYFKRIGHVNKILTILTIFFEAARWVSNGTNKGVIDLIIIFAVVVLIKQWQGKYMRLFKLQKNKQNKKIKTAIIIIILVVSGLLFFGNNISSRVNDNYSTISLITGGTEVNTNSPLMKITPKNYQPLLVYTAQYLTQGYYGLSIALNEPFIPMFGVGNSYFLIENIQQMFDVDIWQYTYQERIEYKGWHPFVNWHSIYVWLANDISFPGVLLLMFFFGKYFALVTYKCLILKDPIASSLLVLILLCFFYFPCNNQILSSPITFMAFWSLNIFWFYKVKIKKTIKNVNLV